MRAGRTRNLPDAWLFHHGRDSGEGFRSTRRDNRANRRRRNHAMRLRRVYRQTRLFILIAIIAVIALKFIVDVFVLSPWPVTVTLMHLQARSNCDAARAVGLAPARRGEPGYWEHLDADGDGISCEPWSPARQRQFEPNGGHSRRQQ
jgi:Excalibur calcium-binding domain